MKSLMMSLMLVAAGPALACPADAVKDAAAPAMSKPMAAAKATTTTAASKKATPVAAGKATTTKVADKSTAETRRASPL